MKNKYIMAMICMFLIISSSFSVYGFNHYDRFIEEQERRDLGEIVLINVDRVEPVTISSDYIRNRHFPVYVYLSGRTIESTLFGDPSPQGLDTLFGDLKIRDVRIIRQSLSRYVSGVQEVPPRDGYKVKPDGSVDLGYLKLYIRRMPVEEDIPDELLINLTARVEFDIDSSFGVLGKQDLFFNSEEQTRRIWDGRASLEFISAQSGKAKFQLYDANGDRIGSTFDLTPGGRSVVHSLRDAPYFLDNKVRFQLKQLFGEADTAKFSISGIEDDVEVIKGMNLFPGSTWIVDSIGYPHVILRNEETGRKVIFDISQPKGTEIRSNVCDTIDFEFSNDELNELRPLIENANLLYLDRYTKQAEENIKAVEKGREKGNQVPPWADPILSPEADSLISGPNYDEILKNLFLYTVVDETKVDYERLLKEVPPEILNEVVRLGEIDRDKFYCSAINQYKGALNTAVGEDRDEINLKTARLYDLLRDKENSLFHYSQINTNSKVYRENSLEFEIDSAERIYEGAREDYKYFDNKKVILKEITSKEGKTTFTASINGISNTYNVGDPLLINNVFYNDRKAIWRVTSVDSRGIGIKLFSEASGEELFTPKFLQQGENLVLRNNDLQEFELVIVDKIDSPVSAVVSVIPGDGRNYGISDFNVHLPIEKSLIQWTPEKIDNMIESTHNTINKLEDIKEKLRKFITTIKLACFSVFSYLAVKNAFFVNNKGRQLAVGEYTNNLCPTYIKSVSEGGKGYRDIEECLRKEGNNIDLLAKKYSFGVDKADRLMKNFNIDKPKTINNVAISLGITDPEKQELFRLAVSQDFAFETGLNTNRLHELLILSETDKEALNKELQSYDVVFEKVESVSNKVKDLRAEDKDNTEIIKDIIRDEFGTFNFGTKTKLENIGKPTDATILANKGFNTDEVIQIISANNLNDGTWQIYDGAKAVTVRQILDDNNNPVYIDGKFPAYTPIDNNLRLNGKKIIYADLEGQEDSLSSQYAENQKNIIQYDEKNRLHIFAFEGTKGTFPAAGKSNYVKVYYGDDGRLSYHVINVGPNKLIDFGKQNIDDITVVDPGPIENREVTRTEDGKIIYDYTRIKSDIEKAYRDRNFRFVKEGHIIEGFIQSNLISRTSHIPTSECINYMSSSDCEFLFGFCDPVLCPASRFDLGGRWQVDNVIQSGIIGSIVLGLPNFSPKEPLPICLEGVHAGLDNIQSGFKGFEECLQKAKATGESVGICNSIRSIYMCEILWREGLSIFGSLGKLADVISEKVFGATRGGGEYANWKTSWNQLQDSVSFFTTTYAQSAFASYKARNVGEFGSEICKKAIFAKNPGVGEFIGDILEPSSPPQYTGWFDELEYASAEGGKSIYRFFYHIFAGRDEDVYYYVYLKGPQLRPLVITDVEKLITRGYLKRGDYKQQSQTVTGDSGYTQMCIVINNRETCGFGKVTSDFSLNFLNEMLINDELNRQIDTPEECNPDTPTLTPSLRSLITPSQHGLLETGISRVCSTYDPDGDLTRWREIGTCGVDENGIDRGKCYLDYNTVSLKDYENREALLARLNKIESNQASEESYKKDTSLANSYLDKLDNTVDTNIENKNMRELLDNALEYRRFITNLITESGDVELLLMRSRNKLGDIYKTIGDIIYFNVESIRAETIKEDLKAVTEPIDLQLEKKNIEINLDIIATSDIKYVWKNNEWKKYQFSGFEPGLNLRIGKWTELRSLGNDFSSGVIEVYNDMKSTLSKYVRVAIDRGRSTLNFRGLDFSCDGRSEKDVQILEIVADTYQLKTEYQDFEGFKNKLISVCNPEYITDVEIRSLLDSTIFASTNRISNGVSTRICSPDNPNDIPKLATWIEKYSSENRVDPLLILSLIMQESNCDLDAVNPDDPSYGLMQITEIAFKDACSELISFDSIKGANNAENNVKCGVKILRLNYDRHKDGLFYMCKEIEYKNWQAALRAYNGAPKTGNLCAGEPNYVEMVWNIYTNLQQKTVVSKVNCEELNLATCVDVSQCYVRDRFFGGPECKDCSVLSECEGIKDKNKCVNTECTQLAGLSCAWNTDKERCVYIEGEVNFIEENIYDLTNDLREQANVPPLKRSADLDRLARYHSTNMANYDFYSHTDNEGLDTPGRARKLEVSGSIAENIDFLYWSEIDPNGCGDTRESKKIAICNVNRFRDSEGHYKNIIGDFSEIGIGVSFDLKDSNNIRLYVTQNFR